MSSTHLGTLHVSAATDCVIDGPDLGLREGSGCRIHTCMYGMYGTHHLVAVVQCKYELLIEPASHGFRQLAPALHVGE